MTILLNDYFVVEYYTLKVKVIDKANIVIYFTFSTNKDFADNTRDRQLRT